MSAVYKYMYVRVVTAGYRQKITGVEDSGNSRGKNTTEEMKPGTISVAQYSGIAVTVVVVL